MKLFGKKEETAQRPGSHAAFLGGSYSVMMTAVVLAIVLAVNLFAGMLPASMTHYDISASQLYSVTSNTKTVLNQLKDDVTIYWIVQADQEDSVLDNLLSKYESLSDHISVVKKNPDVYPTFAQQYTEEEVQNNSLVVESGERNRFIAYTDIYLSEPDLAAQSVNSSFDGEGAITSAIDYVTNEDQPVVYRLEGHGEVDLPDAFADQLEKSNMTVKPLTLLNQDAVPEDSDCLLIYGPQSDFAPEEIDLLEQYIEGGGRLFVAAGPVKDGSLTTLYSLLERYGVTTEQGIVVDSDRERYAFRQPHALLPSMNSSPITDPLLEEHYFPVFPISQGMHIGEAPAGVEVKSILDTSMTAFSKKAGYELENYEKEEGDADGPFTVGLTIQNDAEGQIVWYSSTEFLTDLYNAYSSGANLDLAMNSLSAMIGESDAMAIRTKSLNYNYLTINESTAAMLKVLMVGVVPLAYLGVGIYVVARRRRKCAGPI